MDQNYPKNEKILEDQQAFYFHTSINNYTGHKAHSLKEFEKEICKVDQKSLEFHLSREDFEKWLRFSLMEDALANKIEALRKQNIRGKLLRNWLYTHVKRHSKTAKKPIKVYTTSKANLKKNLRKPTPHSS